MGLLKNIIRPLVPQSIQRKILEARVEARIKREIQNWRDLDLHRELAGLNVKVSSLSDWSVFNEIFVERLYDRAIADVLSQAPTDRMLHVFDLGANVGFFALRFSQMVFQSDYPHRPFFIHCVEGSPRVYAELTARVTANPRLKGHIEVRHGLVGKKSGSTEMYESLFGAGNSTIPQSEHWSKPVTVPYIDLDKLIPNDESIALVKCDIEGSEQTFQDHYQKLLARTQSAIVELHHSYIKPEKFHEGMTALGFIQRNTLWESEKHQASLIWYKR